MNKVLSIISMFLLVALFSCDEKDDLRSDIDALADRVTSLEASIEQMNTDISTYQEMVYGLVLVLSYTVDDQGNYTLELTDGTTLTVYSGEADMDDMPLFSINSNGNWAYTINGITYELTDSDGNTVSADTEEGVTPMLSVNSYGYWLISLDGGTTWSLLGSSQYASGSAAASSANSSSIFSAVDVDESAGTVTFTILADGSTVTVAIYDDEFYLDISYGDDTVTFGLGQTQQFTVEQANVVTAVIENQTWGIVLTETTLTVTAPTVNTRGETYDDELYIKIFSSEGYCRVVKLPVQLLTTTIDEDSTTAYIEFLTGDDNNVLLDYSYAGYMHGESAPPSAAELVAAGYTVYDVTDYGAIPDDGLSDREAFMDVLAEIAGTSSNIKQEDEVDGTYMTDRYIKTSAKAIIYFPEGNYILQDDDSKDRRIRISMGDIVLRGAGRDKTTLEMTVANNSTDETLYNSPIMIEFKHNSGLSDLGTITADAEVGSTSITAGVSGVSAGDWICLTLVNNDADVIDSELSPYTASDIAVQSGGSLNIVSTGIQIYEYHQVKSVSGSTIKLEEPIMHAIDADLGWVVQKYPHYENVGIEDLTFKGYAKEKFVHHASDEDDGGFKPVTMVRVTNSWMRRVNFESVSEALSIIYSANCSAYNINITGNRGHAAIRSQASSRVFIGKVTDSSDGYTLGLTGTTLGTYTEGAGQFHGCGVSKQSMGAVLWNVTYGSDACFESHATQPRCTLIDRCTGPLMHWRAGGDSDQMPNHMENLTLWNYNATSVTYDTSIDTNGFTWWDESGYWWKFLPPIIVGFHGTSVDFDEDEVKRLESNGTSVTPYSLYEAQLNNRLGYVPAWLNALK